MVNPYIFLLCFVFASLAIFAACFIYSSIKEQQAMRKLWLAGWELRQSAEHDESGWGTAIEYRVRFSDKDKWITLNEALTEQKSLDKEDIHLLK